MWCIAVIEGNAHLAARFFDGIENAQSALLINRHRFFGNHIATGMQCTHYVIVMGAVHSGDDNNIRARLADHGFEIRRFPG